MEFNIYTEQKVQKCNEIIEFMRKLAIAISRKSFLTIYKCFEKPNLDYGGILHGKPRNECFKNKLEKIHIKLAS